MFYHHDDKNVNGNIQLVGSLDKVAFVNSLPLLDLPYKDVILDKVVQMNEWVTSYLTKPNENVGRPGAVCPFVRQAIKNKTVFITYHLCQKNIDLNDIQNVMQLHKTYFKKLESLNTSGKYYALMVVFIHVDNRFDQLNDIIERTQQTLKLAFIRDKIMIGQFFNGCKAKGIHNDSFRPFDAPVPTLGIRKILPQDLVFMTDTIDHMECYIDEFKITNKQSLMRLLESVYLDKNKRVLAHADILLNHFMRL